MDWSKKWCLLLRCYLCSLHDEVCSNIIWITQLLFDINILILIPYWWNNSIFCIRFLVHLVMYCHLNSDSFIIILCYRLLDKRWSKQKNQMGDEALEMDCIDDGHKYRRNGKPCLGHESIWKNSHKVYLGRLEIILWKYSCKRPWFDDLLCWNDLA